MAYFLKQTRLKGRTYLAIYEGHYDHDRKGAVNRTVKSLGSVETLKAVYSRIYFSIVTNRNSA